MTTSNGQRELPGRVERFGTVVIGGGQAGLAVGHHLAARDIDFVILSDEARVGDNWRHRWDSLRLFTPARHSGLPGLPFPAPPGHLADKEEVADFLERYAERFDLPVRLQARVSTLGWDGARYLIRVSGSTPVLEADNVIIATGAFQRSRIPAAGPRFSATIHQRHSSEYQNPFELPDGSVIGIPERELQDAGVVRVGRLDDERGGLPICAGTVIEPRVVVWCTGYTPDYGWIELPVFGDDGLPRHERGVASAMPGLFFLGLRFQHRLNSSLIGGVGEDAAFIAEQVARRADSSLSV